jgi:hypothetical protein
MAIVTAPIWPRAAVAQLTVLRFQGNRTMHLREKIIHRIVIEVSVAVFVFTAPLALSQNVPVTQSANQVQCGNVVALAGGKVNLTCQGLTKEQARILKMTIPGMLEKLLNADAEQFASIEAQINELRATTVGGNLAERARSLARAMMVNLAERGWQPPNGHIDLPPGDTPFLHFPTQTESADYRNTWFRNMTNYWRFRFGDSVVGVHDEFAQLHIKDRDLDSFVESYELDVKDLARGITAGARSPVNPYEIQDVANSLVRLADQLSPAVATRPQP